MPAETIRGYTLIELMVVIAIVGILASMAYGTYTGYTAKADRSLAQSELYRIAQTMERQFTETRNYSFVPVTIYGFDFPDSTDPAYIFSGTVITAGYAITATVKSGSNDKYDFRIRQGLDSTLSPDNSTHVEEHKESGKTVWQSGWDIPD